jgi:hypothetical protein
MKRRSDGFEFTPQIAFIPDRNGLRVGPTGPFAFSEYYRGVSVVPIIALALYDPS